MHTSNSKYDITGTVMEDAGLVQKNSNDIKPDRSQQKDKKSYVCNICQLKMTTKQALFKHKKRKHSTSVTEKILPVKCMQCEQFRCSSIKQLIVHLRMEHQMDVETLSIKFDKFSKFLDWKKEHEKATNAWYIQHCGTSCFKEVERFYYYCNRSGMFKSRGVEKRAIKSQGTSKIDGVCCAFMTATVCKQTLSVSVEYCLDHVGHRTELGHLRMSSDLKTTIAGKLAKGITIDKILDDIRDTQGEISRDTLTVRRDIHNIKHQFNVDSVERHSNDRASVSILVEELRKQDYNPIVYFKQQGDKCLTHDENDFLVGIQTEFQRDLMQKHGGKFICMDSTHKTNQYDFFLTTIMVLDDFGEGQPVVFLISNKEDANSLTPFLKAVKERTGEIHTSHFMSDLAGASYNAWVSVFRRPLHRWYCSWHVDRQWRRKMTELVKDNNLQAEIYTYLKLVQYEKKENIFRKQLQEFSAWLSKKSKAFNNYFVSSYVNNDKIKLWAVCFRMGLETPNTNMYLEAFHRIIKDLYFGRKQNRRVDHLISILLKIARDRIFELLIKNEKGKASKRITETMKRHKKSADITDIRCEGEGWWKVKSLEENEVFYDVRLVTEICSCKVICTACQVCVHRYSCTCIDYLLHSFMCKHCHAVHKTLESTSHPQNGTQSDDPSQTVIFDTEYYQNILRHSSDVMQSIKQSRSDVMKLICDVTELVNNATSMDVLNGIKRHLNAAKGVGAGLQVIAGDHSYLTTDVFPSNKKFEKQGRKLFTTKKKMTKRRQLLALPSAQAQKDASSQLAQQEPDICGYCWSVEPPGRNSADEDISWVQCNLL